MPLWYKNEQCVFCKNVFRRSSASNILAPDGAEGKHTRRRSSLDLTKAMSMIYLKAEGSGDDDDFNEFAHAKIDPVQQVFLTYKKMKITKKWKFWKLFNLLSLEAPTN